MEENSLNYSLKLMAKSSVIVLIGMIISKILTYSYKTIIARTFGQQTYGLFSLTFMIFSFILLFFSLGLQSGILRYISLYRGKEQKEKIRYIFRISLKFILPSSIIAGLLLFFFSDLISVRIFHDLGLSIFLKGFAFFIPISLFGNIFYTITRAYEKIGWNSFIGNILATSVQFIFLILFVFLGLKNQAIILSYNLGMTAILIASFLVCRYKIPEIFAKPNIKASEKKEAFRALLTYSWPVMLLSIVTTVFAYIDSFTIGYFMGTSDVGLYNAAATLIELLGIIPSLFLLLFLPLITKEYSRKNFKLITNLSKQVGKWILILNLPFLIIMILFPGAIINILFGYQYLAAENALRFLAIGMFSYSFFLISENLLSMAGKSKTILLNLIIAAVIDLGLNIILTPKYGISGAAISTMISYLSYSLLSLLMAKKYTSITPLKNKMPRIIIIAVLSTLVILVVRSFFVMNVLTAILLGAFFILFYFFLILIAKCLDKNDFMILGEIKRKILRR